MPGRSPTRVRAARAAHRARLESLTPRERIILLAEKAEQAALVSRKPGDYVSAAQIWAMAEKLDNGPQQGAVVQVVVEESPDADDEPADPVEPAADAREPRVH